MFNDRELYSSTSLYMYHHCSLSVVNQNKTFSFCYNYQHLKEDQSYVYYLMRQDYAKEQNFLFFSMLNPKCQGYTNFTYFRRNKSSYSKTINNSLFYLICEASGIYWCLIGLFCNYVFSLKFPGRVHSAVGSYIEYIPC